MDWLMTRVCSAFLHQKINENRWIEESKPYEVLTNETCSSQYVLGSIRIQNEQFTIDLCGWEQAAITSLFEICSLLLWKYHIFLEKNVKYLSKFALSLKFNWKFSVESELIRNFFINILFGLMNYNAFCNGSLETSSLNHLDFIIAYYDLNS